MKFIRNDEIHLEFPNTRSFRSYQAAGETSAVPVLFRFYFEIIAYARKKGDIFSTHHFFPPFRPHAPPFLSGVRAGVHVYIMYHFRKNASRGTEMGIWRKSEVSGRFSAKSPFFLWTEFEKRVR